MKKQEEKINDALLKVALGYQVAEVTEEYAEEDGALKLVKRKKTKKDVPPDLKAVQILLSTDENSGDYGKWSDEQLEEEKRRLLESLASAKTASGEDTKKLSARKKTTKKCVVKKNAAKTKETQSKNKKQGEKK